MKSMTFVLSVFILCFLTSQPVVSQNDIPEMTWNQIPKEDIKMLAWSVDSTAAALVLGNIGELYMTPLNDDLGFELQVHKRIKIFKKEGFNEANVEIPYYSKDNYENVIFTKGQTISINGVHAPVIPKMVIREKINDRWSVLKFTFPNVTEGSIIEYQYTLSSKNLLELREWYFQEKIPTRASKLSIDIESRFEYAFLFQGQENLKSTKPVYSNLNGTTSANQQRTKLSFYTHNQPGLRDEAFVSTLNNYYTRLRFQLSKQYLLTGGESKILSDWAKTEYDLLDNSDLGKRYLKKSNFNKVWEKLRPVFQDSDSTAETIKRIYDWVNQNFSWNGRLTIWANRTGDELLKNPEGSSGEINLLLTGLLREAGLEANPVLLSTRSHERVYKEFPIIDQFNHVIVHVETGNSEFVLLDAGSSLRPLGMVRLEALNDDGWLLKKKSSKWIAIVPSVSDKVGLANISLTDKGECTGSLVYQFKGYEALKERSRLLDANKKPYKESLQKKSEWVVDSASVDNYDKVNLPLKECIALNIPEAGQTNGAFIYFKPTLQFDWEVNPFKSPTRTYPIEFMYPFADRLTTVLTLPTGYKIEEMPKPLNLSFQGGEALFNYNMTQKDNVVTINIKMQVKKTTFIAGAYASFRDFFSQVAAKLEEHLVLKKMSE